MNKTALYRIFDDTMLMDNPNGQSDVVNGVLGVNFANFHMKLYNLYCTKMCEITH